MSRTFKIDKNGITRGFDTADVLLFMSLHLSTTITLVGKLLSPFIIFTNHIQKHINNKSDNNNNFHHNKYF